MSTLKMSKLSVLWWFLSKILYKQIANVYLKYIPLDVFVKCLNAKIKQLLNIHKFIPQKFVMNLLNLDIKKIVQNMCFKIQKNCPVNIGKFVDDENIIQLEIETKNLEEKRYWNHILSTLDVNINSFYSVFEYTWWNANNKVKCKMCNTNLSLYHLDKHHKENYPFLNTDGFMWLKEVAVNFDFIGTLLKRKIDVKYGSSWIKQNINDALETKQKAINELADNKVIIPKTKTEKTNKNKEKIKKNKEKLRKKEENQRKKEEKSKMLKEEKVRKKEIIKMQKECKKKLLEEEKVKRKKGKKRKNEEKKKEKKKENKKQKKTKEKAQIPHHE